MPTLQPTDVSVTLPDGRLACVPMHVLSLYLDDDDVTEHSLFVDPDTGAVDFHIEYELGDCIAVDPITGQVQEYAQVWHRHPFGTDYAELYLG